MAGDNQLFHIDTIIADGQVLAFEDSSGSIEGAAGFENEAKFSASGDDFVLRKRVARMLKAKLQWGPTADPKTFANMSNIQIAMRDSFTGRKCLAPKATFQSLGAIGAGTVDIAFILNAELQWL
jgi:hypothetical protein